MPLIGKLIISLVVAAVASTLFGLFQEGGSPFLAMFGTFSAATIVTTLISSIKFSPASTADAAKKPAKKSAEKPTKQPSKASSPVKKTSSANREEGEVKWFNVTKGFGFITRDNGEEIFVHFRSILGEGRRSLRDGQRVSYVVSDSDKGPQAEEVEGLE